MGLIKKSLDPVCLTIRDALVEKLPTVDSLTACIAVNRQFSTIDKHQFGAIRCVAGWSKKTIKIHNYYPHSMAPDDVVEDFLKHVEFRLVKTGLVEEVENLWGDILFPGTAKGGDGLQGGYKGGSLESATVELPHPLFPSSDKFTII
jgi:hypothetical protein